MHNTAITIFRFMVINLCDILDFKLNAIILNVVAPYKYIGHFTGEHISNDTDIHHSIRGTMLLSCNQEL